MFQPSHCFHLYSPTHNGERERESLSWPTLLPVAMVRASLQLDVRIKATTAQSATTAFVYNFKSYGHNGKQSLLGRCGRLIKVQLRVVPTNFHGTQDYAADTAEWVSGNKSMKEFYFISLFEVIRLALGSY